MNPFRHHLKNRKRLRKYNPRRIFREAGDVRRGCVFKDPLPYAFSLITQFFRCFYTLLYKYLRNRI